MTNYVDEANKLFSDETKALVGINERYENESGKVQKVRFMYGKIIQELTEARTEAGRNYSLAITHAEDSCIRAIKALYS